MFVHAVDDEVLRLYNLPRHVGPLHLYVLFSGFHLRSGGIYKYEWFSVKAEKWVDCAYIIFRNPEEAQLALVSFTQRRLSFADHVNPNPVLMGILMWLLVLYVRS
jgi:hypothetical protein